MSSGRSKRVSVQSSRASGNASASIDRGFELLRNQYLQQMGQDLLGSKQTTTGIMKTYENYRTVSEEANLRRLAPPENASRLQVQNYLIAASGHERPVPQVSEEHCYSMNWTKHPDPQLRVLPTQYLFMKNFPRHLAELAEKAKETKDEAIDVVTVEEEMKKIPFLAPKPHPTALPTEVNFPEISEAITESWSSEKNKLWTRANKILDSDRVVRLTFEGHCNEVLLRRNLLDQTSTKFRELLGSTFWEPNLVRWLHETLMEYLNPYYKAVYLDVLQLLRMKLPELMEKHFPAETSASRVLTSTTGSVANINLPNLVNRPHLNDPLANTLNHFKPKKLDHKPIFLIVPYAPNFNQNSSPRYKNWINLLSALGKVISLPCVSKGNDLVLEVLNEIRFNVCEKIRTCSNNYYGRPLVLVGFNIGSLLAITCAIQFPRALSAIVCLGFPLYSLNGPRGELGDPLLELSVPIQFIVGELAITSQLDDMEDFRERMVSAETALVVVGGSDDKLVMAHEKMRRECLSQTMVDRVILEQIRDFLEHVFCTYREEAHDGRHITQIQQQQQQQQQLLMSQLNAQNVNNQQTSAKKRPSSGGRKKVQLEVISNDPSAEKPKPKRKRYYKPKTPKASAEGMDVATTPATPNESSSASIEVAPNIETPIGEVGGGGGGSADHETKKQGRVTKFDIANNSFGSLKVEKPKTMASTNNPTSFSTPLVAQSSHQQQQSGQPATVTTPVCASRTGRPIKPPESLNI